MIKVLIVEDSPSIVEILKTIFEMSDEIEVVGVVSSGGEAVNFVTSQNVDVITMDFNLQGMNGLEATKRIMASIPKPIVIMSSSFDSKNSKDTFRALEAGAISVFDKPNSIEPKEFENYAKELIRHIKLISEIRVVTRKRTKVFRFTRTLTNKKKIRRIRKSEIKIVAIGSSTGGPQVLKDILSKLKKNFPLPVLVVQHITKNFTLPMVEWMNEVCDIKIKLAEDKESVMPGTVYIAPDDYHLTITRSMRISLVNSPPVHSVKPAVSKLFESVNYNVAPKCVGILLTGMGKDGAIELKTMRDTGAITIAQSEDSCVVFGMPKEAIALNAASLIMSPDEIIEFLNNIGETINDIQNIHR